MQICCELIEQAAKHFVALLSHTTVSQTRQMSFLMRTQPMVADLTLDHVTEQLTLTSATIIFLLITSTRNRSSQINEPQTLSLNCWVEEAEADLSFHFLSFKIDFPITNKSTADDQHVTTWCSYFENAVWCIRTTKRSSKCCRSCRRSRRSLQKNLVQRTHMNIMLLMSLHGSKDVVRMRKQRENWCLCRKLPFLFLFLFLQHKDMKTAAKHQEASDRQRGRLIKTPTPKSHSSPLHPDASRSPACCASRSIVSGIRNCHISPPGLTVPPCVSPKRRSLSVIKRLRRLNYRLSWSVLFPFLGRTCQVILSLWIFYTCCLKTQNLLKQTQQTVKKNKNEVKKCSKSCRLTMMMMSWWQTSCAGRAESRAERSSTNPTPAHTHSHTNNRQRDRQENTRNAGKGLKWHLCLCFSDGKPFVFDDSRLLAEKDRSSVTFSLCNNFCKNTGTAHEDEIFNWLSRTN